MSAPGLILERFTRVAPLGVRFWDAVSGAVIGDGLTVEGYPAGQESRRTQAVVNHLGVYVLWHLPGMHAVEAGAGDAAYWASLPPPRRFVIEVTDGLSRFLPFTLAADLPVKGLFPWTCDPLASPVAAPPAPASTLVPLFSAPSRPVPAGMAVLRADLWDPGARSPAAWAAVGVSAAGRPPVWGIADGQGRVAVLFPYPEPPAPWVGPGSPPAGPPRPLTQQEWPVQLTARYAPALSAAAVPDLCATLQQPPAFLWADSARTQPLTGAVLHFGEELIVRTGATATVPLSVLYITPAASPP